MPIDIPESGQAALSILLRTTPEFLESLHVALQNVQPTIFQRGSLAADLASKLHDHPEASPANLRNILDMITGILGWRDSETPSKLASELISSARESGNEKLIANDADWERLRPYLEKFFSVEQLRISAKALMLFSTTPRHMHSARVVTDARPIFTKSANEGPTAFVVVHTLQIEYHEDGQEREWFITLDSGDLESLRDAMSRAIEKERNLKSTLRKTSLPILAYGEERDANT